MTLHRPIRLGGFGDDNSDYGDLPLGTAVGPDGAPVTSSGSILDQITKGATDYYKALSAVQSADLAAQLAKAQGQAAVARAQAGGAYAAQTAGGARALPSPSLLLVAGLVLGTAFLLSRK